MVLLADGLMHNADYQGLMLVAVTDTGLITLVIIALREFDVLDGNLA